MNRGGSTRGRGVSTRGRGGGRSSYRMLGDSIKINRPLRIGENAPQSSNQNLRIESSERPSNTEYQESASHSLSQNVEEKQGNSLLSVFLGNDQIGMVKNKTISKLGKGYVPILKDIDDVLIPPGKYSEQIVALNQELGGLYYPNYSKQQQFPELAKFRNYFSGGELAVADALWHNATTGYMISFKQNIVSMIRHMRNQRLIITSLKEKLGTEVGPVPEVGHSSSIVYPSTSQQNEIKYCRTLYEVLLEVPDFANPIVTQQMVSEKVLALTWAKKFKGGETPDGIVLIPGYLGHLPIGKIYESSSASKFDREFLFQNGLIGQITVSRDLSEIDFLGSDISQRIKAAMKDYLPFNIFCWVSSPDEQTPGFCLLRITDEESTTSDVVLSSGPVDLGPDDLTRHRCLAILEIAQRLQDTSEKWYTLYQKPGCVIQTSDPYNGAVEKLSKHPPIKQIRVPAMMLDCTCIGIQNQKIADKVRTIIPDVLPNKATFKEDSSKA